MPNTSFDISVHLATGLLACQISGRYIFFKTQQLYKCWRWGKILSLIGNQYMYFKTLDDINDDDELVQSWLMSIPF